MRVGTSRGATICVQLLATFGALRWLWMFWTPRCNEACAGSVVVTMYATMCAIVVATLGVVALTMLGRLRPKQAAYAYVALAAAFAVWIALLTGWATGT